MDRVGQLSHDEAARLGQYCPNCGLISHELNPRLYLCPECGAEGYDCCFPAGTGTVCRNCEEGIAALARMPQD